MQEFFYWLVEIRAGWVAAGIGFAVRGFSAKHNIWIALASLYYAAFFFVGAATYSVSPLPPDGTVARAAQLWWTFGAMICLLPAVVIVDAVSERKSS